MSVYTAERNTVSIETIREQINRKTSATPYLANGRTVSHVITDMDHHPYSRWFRGVYYYPDPVIMEREAGFRPIENGCYSANVRRSASPEPKYCFEPPCNTIFPCNPRSFADKTALERRVDRECLVQYR